MDNKTEDIKLTEVTKEGIEAFLASGFTKGVGKVYARKIVDKFGEKILQPDFDFRGSLKEIPGLGENKIEEFVSSINGLKVPLRVLAFLYSAGLKDVEVEKIVSHYGKRLEKVISWDPYDMVENVWKLSFFTADKIGKFMNVASDDPRRLKGALLTAVKFYAEEGNMFATESQTLQTASRISKVEEEKIRPAIDSLIENGRIISDETGGYYNGEKI